VREALENNPDIRAAQQRWEAAKAVIPQVKTLPDPMLNLGYDTVEDRVVTYGVSQEIPFPGKLRLRGKVATSEAERLEQEYLAVPLRIIARLKEAFYDLAFVHRSLETVEKNRRVLLDFAQTAEARYHDRHRASIATLAGAAQKYRAGRSEPSAGQAGVLA
jgi:outer membrane protein TolC